ncbi:MAG: 2-oxoacid:acceptor oxidoreductase family protein [Candidatus Methanofastidiosia archaeon]|jgi:2-oxoglutarate ferredoxin oxidoreductase subunit alpha
MRKNVFTYIVGGKAGEGVKKAGSVAVHIFSTMKRQSFEMDDYQSLIRGGHNFSVVSTCPQEITSHYMKADLVVAHDERSFTIHETHLKEHGIMVYNSDEVDTEKELGIGIPMTSTAKEYPNPSLRLGVGSVAVLAAGIGLSINNLKDVITKEYPDPENNSAYAQTIYEYAEPEIGSTFKLKQGTKMNPSLTGNEAVALGATAAGLDMYYAYPMTPSTSILHFFARHKELGVVAIHPENEIGVANMAVGSAFAGAKSMVGSSGGGIALMEETFSLAGMTETPVLFVLSSRSGPSTGVPTYTEQADLNFALHQGHGDFPRIVAAPGTIAEAFYTATDMMRLVWQFQTPGILMLDKHISESSHTVDIDPEKAVSAECVMHDNGEYKRYTITDTGISPLLFPPREELIKWNSYEHDERGITTDKADKIVLMHDKRAQKGKTIVDHIKGMHTVNVYKSGDIHKDTNTDTNKDTPVIYTFGSSTMSVLEALRAGDINATVVQPVYLEPFPIWEFVDMPAGIVIEQNVSGQFRTLLQEKTGITCDLINQYNGRPFDPYVLANEIQEVIP